MLQLCVCICPKHYLNIHTKKLILLLVNKIIISTCQNHKTFIFNFNLISTEAQIDVCIQF